MTSLLKWDPVREFEDFGRRMAPLFAQIGREGVPERGRSMTVFDWAPSVDVTEDEEGYEVSAELPDVKKQDLKVSVENGILRISGERKKDREEKDGVRYHRVERCYGSFHRSFTLPDDADPSDVTATMKGGILKVRIEKRLGTSATEIPVESEQEEEEEEA